jgi:hypothetical protein
MTLQLPRAGTAPLIHPETPAIDRMTREGRAALLNLVWAAWYSSLSDTARHLLAGIGSQDPLQVARAAGVTTEATLKLLRLRRLASGDAGVRALVDGLLAGTPVLHVPAMLRQVMESSDVDRRRMLNRARAEVSLLPREDVTVIAGVIAYLVGTEVDYSNAIVVEAPLARGYTRSVLQALGLPVHAYMPQLRCWL